MIVTKPPSRTSVTQSPFSFVDILQQNLTVFLVVVEMRCMSL